MKKLPFCPDLLLLGWNPTEAEVTGVNDLSRYKCAEFLLQSLEFKLSPALTFPLDLRGGGGVFLKAVSCHHTLLRNWAVDNNFPKSIVLHPVPCKPASGQRQVRLLL